MTIPSPGSKTPVFSFEEVTALEGGDGRFDAEVNHEWTIGDKPNGGYLLAMLGRAASSVSEHRDVIAASAHYVSAPEPGSVVIETEVLRKGRSASQVRARMSQGSRLCVETVMTIADLDANATPYWSGGVPVVSRVPFEDCPRLFPSMPSGTRVALMEQVDIRLEPESAGYKEGKPSGRGELRGWLALPEGEPFSPVSLLFAVDAFPPATFDIEFAGWVPTFEMTVYVRALPAPGPVRVLQRAQLVDDHRVDECCFVWDHTGRLVASATQLAGIRLG